MTHMIKIEAEDGHTLEAAVAGDPDTARGGVVVLQEIFGLNEHIRDLPRRFAEAGYFAIAPAMFCLLYTSPSPRDSCASRMPSSA